MKCISWNVNGLRAVVNKGFMEFFNEINADIFAIQETKMQEGQLELILEGYYQYWNSAEKKGYSGTAIFTKKKPINVSYGIGIDLKNPKTNRRNAGFTDEERNKMTNLLDAGFTDSFRYLYPEKENCYSWWSYMGRAREKNVGWRIDYFIVSNSIQNKIKESAIHPEILGSDHCPVELQIEI